MNTVNIELDINQLNLVLVALSKLPLESTYDTFNAIRSQADSQLEEKPKKNSAEIFDMPLK